MGTFGNTTGGSYFGRSSDWSLFSKAYLCDEVGNQTVTDIQVYGYRDAGNSYYKNALYSSASPAVLICQGDNKVLAGTSAAWMGHAGLSGTTTITGGTSYRLATSHSNNDYTGYYGYHTGSSGDSFIGEEDFVYSSYTTPYTLGTSDNWEFQLQCLYEAAAGGASAVPEYYSTLLRKKKTSWVYSLLVPCLTFMNSMIEYAKGWYRWLS